MRATENKAAAAHTRPQHVAVDWSLKGKTVLLTGASRGMGRFAAIELARLGAEILVAGTTGRAEMRRLRRSAVPAVGRGSCARIWATPRRYPRSRRPCSRG